MRILRSWWWRLYGRKRYQWLWLGDLDEVETWNHALSPEEIADHYTESRPSDG